MKLEVPTHLVVQQGNLKALDQSPIFSMYRTLSEGGDLAKTTYAKLIGPMHMEWRRQHLEESFKAPLVLDEPLPAHLTALGRFELMDGHHRAIRAVFEGRPTLPIEVKSISPMWQRMVDDLRGIYPGRVLLYQDIEHPFFADWPLDRDPQRVRMIVDAVLGAGIRPKDGAYLEIGSCTGRFSREFARHKFVTYGVERDPVVLRIAEYLGIVFNLNGTFYLRDDPDKLIEGLGDGYTFSVVLCLSVFHRYIARGDLPWVEALYRRCIRQSKVFITDAGSTSDVSLQPSPIPLDVESYAQWLKSLAGPNKNVRHLGSTEGRPVFMVM